MIVHTDFRINGTMNFVTDYGEELVIRRRFDSVYTITMFDRDAFELIKFDVRIEDVNTKGMLRRRVIELLKILENVYDEDIVMVNFISRFIRQIEFE